MSGDVRECWLIVGNAKECEQMFRTENMKIYTRLGVEDRKVRMHENVW